MRFLSSFFLVALAAILAFDGTVNYPALEKMEKNFEGRLARNPGKLPFDLLSNATAMYVPGVGVSLSSRVNLVYVTPGKPVPPTHGRRHRRPQAEGPPGQAR